MPSQVSGQNERGLRLLSIGTAILNELRLQLTLSLLWCSDGGGIRGLSPLLMLKEILYRIQQEKRLRVLPRPCDIFDLAGGTSTGGCVVDIAISILQLLIDFDWQAYRDHALSATNVN